MKKILLLALLTMGLVYANLPPTSSKGSGESGYSTTFQTDYDSIPVTRSGINVKIGTIPTSKGGTGNTATPSNGQLLVGNGSGFTLATVTGTANQVNVTNGSGSITLSTPQNIATNSNVQFANLTATGTTTLATSLTGPLKGTSGVVSASAINLTSEVTGVLPVANGGTGSGTQNFVDLTNTQTAAGVKTFSSGIKTDSIQTTGSSGVELKNSGGTLVATFGPTNTTNVSMAGGLNVSGAITAGSYSNNLSAFASTTSSQLAGVISDETGSGSLVFGTTPTFTTNLTAPLLIGGTGTTSTLTYKTTSGVGVTGADHIFQVGNNGATEAMRIQNNGNIGIGTASPNANALVDISSTTKAFMPPRMTKTQRDAIASPTAGMVVYNTTNNTLDFYNGTIWASQFANSDYDWTAFTPTTTGLGTITAGNTCKHKRLAERLYVECVFTTGTTTAALGSITLPNSLTIDSSKLGVNNTTAGSGQRVGWSLAQGNAGSFIPVVTATGTATDKIYFAANATGAAALLPANGNATHFNGAVTSINFDVPISGWTSSGGLNDVVSTPGGGAVKMYAVRVSDSSGTVGSDIGDLVNGNTSLASNDFTYTFNSGKFTGTPICVASCDRADETCWATTGSASSSGVIVSTYNTGGLAARAHTIYCFGN